MRVLLRPVLVPELGLVIVKPGRESMPVFHNTRVLVEPEPKSMRNLPSGVVPAVRQQRLKLSLSGRLAIKVIAEPPDKRRRDLDNILKAPLDALTHAGVLMDDEQFDEINIVRGQPVSGGRLGVKIYPIMHEEQVKK